MITRIMHIIHITTTYYATLHFSKLYVFMRLEQFASKATSDIDGIALQFF